MNPFIQTQDAIVFSKVVGKISTEFLTRLVSKQELYTAFFSLIRSKPGVELIYDEKKNMWYVGGSWDSICLIRQQMIVLIDCVFTFNNAQSFEQESQMNQHLIVQKDATQHSLDDQQTEQLINPSISSYHLRSNLDDPNVIIMPSLRVIAKGTVGDGVMNSVLDECPPDEVNFSIIERLETMKNCDLFSTNDPSTILTFDSDEENQSNVDHGSVDISLDGLKSNQTMTSAILDLSRKVHETYIGQPLENPTFFGLHQDNQESSSHDTAQLGSENIPSNLQDVSHHRLKKNSGSKTTSTNTCVVCSKTFLNKSNMIRHARSIHKISNFNQLAKETQIEEARDGGRWSRGQSNDSVENRSCKFCLKVFSTRSNLYKHTRKCKQAHECTMCHEKMESHNLLCHHVYVNHSLFLCQMCDKIVDSEENYADHVNFCHPNYSLDDVITTPGKNGDSNDSDRNQTFVRSGSCMSSVGMGGSENKHPIRCHRPNPCLKCGKVFSTFSNLLKHIRVIHENARFPCNLCKRVFACKDGLKNHMDKIHNKITYKCDICSMEFDNQLRLAKHLNLIHDRQSSMYNFQCELCGKTFLYKTNLKRHKKLEHEGMRYSCQRCMNSFRSKNQLNEHHRIVHLGILLKCDSCDKQFHTWTTLRDHERAVHGKHAPIICVVCGKKFTRYPGLSYHLRKHHKRKYNVAGDVTSSHVVEEKKVGEKKNNGTSKTTESPSEHPITNIATITPGLSENVSFAFLSPCCTSQNNDNLQPFNDNITTCVPSFYGQQFPDMQKESPPDKQPPTPPIFVASSDSTKCESTSLADFSVSACYGDMEESAILCFSDTINFYDNFNLSPDHQQPVGSNTFSTGEFNQQFN